MANQEYIQPAPPQQHINLQNEAEDFFSQKVTPLRQEIMKTMKNNGASTNPSHKDRNTVPKNAMLSQFPLNNNMVMMPGSHKASFIGGNTPKSHGIEAGSTQSQGAQSSTTPSGQNNYYLNKLRQ